MEDINKVHETEKKYKETINKIAEEVKDSNFTTWRILNDEGKVAVINKISQ